MSFADRVSNVAAHLTMAAVFFLPFSKSASEAAGIAAVVLWTVLGPRGRFRHAPRAALPLYGIFLAAVAFSLTAVPGPSLFDSFRGALKWLKYVGFFFMSADLFRDPARLRRLATVFLASLVLVALNGFYQVWTGADWLRHNTAHHPGRFDVRMTSSFGSPNGLGAFLIVGIPLAFAEWVRRKTWSAASAAALAVLALLSVSLAMTLSRGAILALALASSVYVVWRVPKALWALAAGLGAFLLSSRIVFGVLVESLRLGDATVSERLRVWKITWSMIAAHPFAGNGVNTYYKNFPAFIAPGETFRGYAHNCYLQMWSEIGIFGTAAFIAALAAFFIGKKPADALKPLHGALWVGLAAFALQSAVDTNFYALQAAYLFWIFWGAFCSAGEPGKRPKVS